MPKSTGIPVGKKRYTFTLTEKTLIRIHSLFDVNRVPRSLVSILVDDFLETTMDTFDQLRVAQERKGGKLGTDDVFAVVGGIMKAKHADQFNLI